jgi:hypothetical protein
MPRRLTFNAPLDCTIRAAGTLDARWWGRLGGLRVRAAGRGSPVSELSGRLPGQAALFGGNSNGRGPVWVPLNYLGIEALERYHDFLGDAFTVECPTGSGTMLTLQQVAAELRRRLIAIFLPGPCGRRPLYGAVARYHDDPGWRGCSSSTSTSRATTARGWGRPPDRLDGPRHPPRRRRERGRHAPGGPGGGGRRHVGGAPIPNGDRTTKGLARCGISQAAVGSR